MKRLQSLGHGSNKRKAEILSQDEEEALWEKGLLGDATPQTLLDTMVFCNGLNLIGQSLNHLDIWLGCLS